MMPQDPKIFASDQSADWITTSKQWFRLLASSDALTVVERVHLARLAIQQQWAADVKDTMSTRSAIQRLGLCIATVSQGYLIVSGSPTLADYVSFRHRKLNAIEKGLLYGYPPTATLAFTGLLSACSPQPWPETCAEYFLAGAYSRDHTERERAFFTQQWKELQRQAPEICSLADTAYASARPSRAA